MKFLDSRFNGRNLLPIHIVSYDVYELGARDAIAITFQDMDTKQVFVETIDKPKYEVYVLKREYWDSVRYMKAYEEIEKLDKYTISYHFRDQDLAKILGCAPGDVKYSPFIFGYDISIEHFYWMHFILEYGNDLPKHLSKGFLDIESDIIQTAAGGFAAPGEAPTSAITFIDADARQVYTLVLCKDNLPIVAETNPHYHEYEEIKKSFYEQVDDFCNHLDDFVKELHEDFDDVYGEFTYNVLTFDEEIHLHQAIWEIIRHSGVLYLLIWNAPYDARNLIERPLALGYEPESIICDSDFKYKTCFFEEDDNILPHKRNHRCVMSVKPLILCQMWGYAGIRSGQAKQRSLKLTVIAKKEIGDEKLDYSEEGSIRTFFYRNFRKYIKYNIKDVLLQFGIEERTEDLDNIYDRCYENAMLLPEAFVSTTMLTQSLTKFLYQEGFIIGTNANRIMAPFDYKQFIGDHEAASNIAAMQEDAEEFDPDTPFDIDDVEEDDYGSDDSEGDGTDGE